MNIVFCADRSALPGLHIAAYSLLDNIDARVAQTRIYVFSDQLDDRDAEMLRQTLAGAGKPFMLELRRIDAAVFDAFPDLNGSRATYYRLLVPRALNVERFLYVDADTLCSVDVSVLATLEMGGCPAALVPEAPLAGAMDRFTAEKLGNHSDKPYFNAGVILVNVPAWQRERVTENALSYIASFRPQFHDQSALNWVLQGKAVTLDERFNCIANKRTNWPYLRPPLDARGKLIHFLDYPKPWDLFAEWVHPQYHLWRAVMDKTAMKGFRSWHAAPSRKFPKTRKAWTGYKKALKDRLLFAGYSRGWFRRVKGVPSDIPALSVNSAPS